MSLGRRLAAGLIVISLAACAGATATPPFPTALIGPGWIPTPAAVRSVGLGWPGGARLDDGVAFAGGLQIVAEAESPLHGLSDLKLVDGGFVAVSDSGDLVRGSLILDGDGQLTALSGLRSRRLTLQDGRPVMAKADGDAEGVLVTAEGALVVSFERDHRIWDYGSPDAPRTSPVARTRPDTAFPSNAGMEAIAVAPGGWRVAGEAGGVWDCAPTACAPIVASTPLARDAYRTTGMDRDPSGGGWFVVQRFFSPPIDARARVRRMAVDGALGPVLVELKLPGTTDNFEGVAAMANGDGGVRLYILSDDNGSRRQRTLIMAFDVPPETR